MLRAVSLSTKGYNDEITSDYNSGDKAIYQHAVRRNFCVCKPRVAANESSPRSYGTPSATVQETFN